MMYLFVSRNFSHGGRGQNNFVVVHLADLWFLNSKRDENDDDRGHHQEHTARDANDILSPGDGSTPLSVLEIRGQILRKHP